MSPPRLSTLVAVLLGGLFLAGILIPTGTHPGPSKEQATTKSLLSDIMTACYIYRSEYGMFPKVDDAAQLWRKLEGENPRKLRFFSPRDSGETGFRDAWDRPITVRNRSAYMELRSAGKDGIFFTKEDLVLDFSPEGLRRGVRD